MNSTSITSISNPIKGIDNSVLEDSEIETPELSDDELANEFTAVMQEAFTASGNTKPLEFADLQKLDFQQLSELAERMGIHITPEMLDDSPSAEQSLLSVMALEINPTIRSENLMANPNASEILKSTIVNKGTLKEGITENSLSGSQLKQSDLLNRLASEVVVEHAMNKKEPGLVNGLTVAESESTQFMKELTTKDVASSRELLLQLERQDLNTLKTSDKLAITDRPNNGLNSISNPTALVQPQSHVTSSGMMLNRVDVPVQQAGWGEAVGSRLMMMVNDKIQSASIRLNPAELGPIEVKVNLNHDQATVHFVSNNSVVRDAIEDAFPRLKEMLSQNGLSLSDANVSQQSSHQSNSNSKNESGLQFGSDKGFLDADDSQTEIKPIYVDDMGLVDHYV